MISNAMVHVHQANNAGVIFPAAASTTGGEASEVLPVGVTVLRLVWLTGLDAHAEVAPVSSEPVSSAGQSSSSVSDGGSDGVECSVVTVVEPAPELPRPGSECVTVAELEPELLGPGSELLIVVEL